MKKIISLCLFLTFLVSSMYAQNEKTAALGFDQLIGPSGIYSVTVDTYKGSPYFPRKFVKGYIMLDKRTRTKNILLRYNKYKNTVEYLKDDDVYSIKGKQINGFIMLAKPFNVVFRNGFKTDKNLFNPSAMLRVIYDGKIKFLAHHTTELFENIIAYQVAGDVNEYISKIKYYLITDNEIVHPVELMKDDILKVLNKNKSKLLSFINKNDLEFSNEQHLKKILGYYELLQEKKND